MYVEKSRQFQEEDGVQSAQREHYLIKERKERKERKNESAYKANSADAESD